MLALLISVAILSTHAAPAERPQSEGPPVDGAIPEHLQGVWESSKGGTVVIGADWAAGLPPMIGYQGRSFARYRNGRLWQYDGGYVDVRSVSLDGEVLVMLDKEFVRTDRSPEDTEIMPLEIPKSRRKYRREWESISEEVVRRWEREQTLIGELEKASSEKLIKAREERLTKRRDSNATWIAETIERVGWLDTKRFGEAAERATCKILGAGVGISNRLGTVLHLPVCLACREHLVQAHAAGLWSSEELATFIDAIELWQGRPQVYGTRIDTRRDDSLEPVERLLAPLRDPDSVDERRAELGLEPLGIFLERESESGLQVRRITWPEWTAFAWDWDDAYRRARERAGSR